MAQLLWHARKHCRILLGLSILLCLSGSARVDTQSGAHWATIHGHKIYFETFYKPSGAGRPLLLLHGGGASIADSFSHQLSDFAAQHRIIAPEQVGQGHSPDTSEPLSYASMMEDTAALLQQLHIEDVDVVGWSDGGILALMLAAKYPRLVHRVVISGANISPDGLLDNELEALRNEIATTAAPSKLQRLWLSSPTPAELNWRHLQQLHKPVLVMAGDRDVIKPGHTRDIYATLPQAQLSVLPDTGHATFSERPELVNPLVLRFLAQD